MPRRYAAILSARLRASFFVECVRAFGGGVGHNVDGVEPCSGIGVQLRESAHELIEPYAVFAERRLQGGITLTEINLNADSVGIGGLCRCCDWELKQRDEQQRKRKEPFTQPTAVAEDCRG